jgi:hypothetical protein
MITSRRVVAFLILVVAAAGFFFAGTQRRAETPVSVRDRAVERLIPADGSPVAVRQAPIGIDLTPGYRGILIINGLEIPEDELDRNDPLSQVMFQPGAGKSIEELPPGPVTVTAVIWNPIDGETRDEGRTVRWSFRVA